MSETIKIYHSYYYEDVIEYGNKKYVVAYDVTVDNLKNDFLFDVEDDKERDIIAEYMMLRLKYFRLNEEDEEVKKVVVDCSDEAMPIRYSNAYFARAEALIQNARNHIFLAPCETSTIHVTDTKECLSKIKHFDRKTAKSEIVLEFDTLSLPRNRRNEIYCALSRKCSPFLNVIVSSEEANQANGNVGYINVVASNSVPLVEGPSMRKSVTVDAVSIKFTHHVTKMVSDKSIDIIVVNHSIENGYDTNNRSKIAEEIQHLCNLLVSGVIKKPLIFIGKNTPVLSRLLDAGAFVVYKQEHAHEIVSDLLLRIDDSREINEIDNLVKEYDSICLNDKTVSQELEEESVGNSDDGQQSVLFMREA